MSQQIGEYSTHLTIPYYSPECGNAEISIRARIVYVVETGVQVDILNTRIGVDRISFHDFSQYVDPEIFHDMQRRAQSEVYRDFGKYVSFCNQHCAWRIRDMSERKTS